MAPESSVIPRTEPAAPGEGEIQARSADVIIVGAGLSGLQAAVTLQNAGLSCIVLEANDRVGGKTLSVATGFKNNKAVVDVGGAWINDTSQDHMWALAKRYGLECEVQRSTGFTLFQWPDGSISKIPFGDLPYGDSEQEMLMQFLGQMDELVKQSNLEYPASGPDALDLDKISLKDYYETHSKSSAVAEMATVLCRGLLGVDPDEISLLFFLNYCKSGTGIQNLDSDEKDGGQYLRLKQGTMSFSTCLVKELRSGSVLLSTPVVGICQSGAGCVVRTATGQHFPCKRVIVSIPTPLYPTISFEPPLPADKTALAENTVLGYYAKNILIYESPWWREAGLSGAFESLIGPVSFSRDTCIPDNDQYSITCFIVGETGRQWSKVSAAARRRQVLDQIRTIFQGAMPKLPEPIKVIEYEWIKQPWSRGAPSPVMPPGVLTSNAGKALRSSFRNVHFVGTETSVVWKGYMEGAVRSGIRGSNEVIASLSKTSSGCEII